MYEPSAGSLLCSAPLMTRRGSWTSRFAFVSLLAGIFAACEVPEYRFTDEEPHCRNGLLDFELGETGIDCAGVCRPCGDGEPCREDEDCLGGQCLDELCLGEACGNGELDPDEIAVDCGGNCAPCETGSPCVAPEGCVSGVCTDSICQPPSCSDAVTNGAETGKDCGGGDCDPCRGGERCTSGDDCMSGICTEGYVCTSACPAGFAECDLDYEVQCETNPNTDANHCGECGNACALAHATALCNLGQCAIDQCEAPYENCDADQDTGCETNVTADPAHCGACGKECPDVNGTPDCVNSKCRIDCDEGFDNCDDAVANGCETKSSFDTQNCGRCKYVCERGEDDEEPWCKAGECGSTACPEGRGDCDGDGDCDYDLTSDPDSCNTCGTPCVVANGTPSCTDRVCGIEKCDDGYDNCDAGDEDGGYANGCETNTDDDVNNCGGCGIVCEIENATAKCQNGRCVVDTCERPYANCDDDRTDCETNTDTSRANCGTCGIDCNDDEVLANATGQCSAGVCKVLECDDGYADCTSANGCETQLASSEANCGMCGIECVDRGGTNTCSLGSCQLTCSGTYLDCDDNVPNGCEVDGDSDPAHCGSCNVACLTPEGTRSNVCTGGVCFPTCEGAFQSCDGKPENGCETDTATDPDNCDVCGTRCLSPNGTLANPCDGGSCKPQCAPTHGNCDGQPTNGCEEVFASNPDHCGQCNRKCQSGGTTHASSSSCNADGKCEPECEEHYAACAEPWRGCTTDLRSAQNCGACGAACGATTQNCVVLADGYRCQAAVTLASDVEGQATGTQLTLSHTAQAGTNRLLLVGIVADSRGGTLATNRPTSVTYGGTPMLQAFERDGGSAFFSPDLYFYYLTEEGGFAASSSPVTIAITSTARDGAVVFANALQFNGARQGAPAAERGAANGGASTLAAALPITVPGSRVYSMTGWYWDAPGPTAAVSNADASVMSTYSSPLVTAGDLRMRASGVFITAGNASLLPAGTTTVTWSYLDGPQATQSSVVIQPAVAE